MEEMQYLEMFDAIVAQHRAFADVDYIHEQLQHCYKRRLAEISSHLPVAAQVLDALCRTTVYNRYRAIGDTVVRCAINHARWQLETGTPHGLPLDECEEVFGAIIYRLEEDKFGEEEDKFSETLQLSAISKPYHGRVWNGAHSEDVFNRAFRRVIQGPCGNLCTPNADELKMLEKGALLLSELLPLLSRSALRHVHLIALFPEVGLWKGVSSMSEFGLGGTIFLNKEFLQYPWWVAEQLLHESLHQKLYDFRHGHSLLGPDFSRKDAPRVCSLWNVPDSNRSNYWDAHRAVAAFHVYVHLALLSTIAEHRAPELENKYGPKQEMTDSRKAMDRAHYLGEKIMESCWQELGLAGKKLIEWLIAVLEALDPFPPPRGSYLHLLLDRYQREAQRVKTKVESYLVKENSRWDDGQRKAESSLSGHLANVIKYEIESTRCVLSAVAAASERSRFDNRLERYVEEELGTKFSELRSLIVETILNVSSDGYRLTQSSPEEKTADEVVRQMVERSSEQLQEILTG